MKIPGNEIAERLQTHLKQKVDILKSKGITPSLTTILIGDSTDQESYVSKKRSVAEKIGAGFTFLQLPQTTSPSDLKKILHNLNEDSNVSGIIVQQPLPTPFAETNIYDFISPKKEIEGHIPDSPFTPPIALAVIRILHFIIDQSITQLDIVVIKKFLADKNIVIVGRSITGGAPIMRAFKSWNIPYTNIHSKTENPGRILKNADLVITAVGKYVIQPKDLKNGVILMNAGLRKEDGKLRGDYYGKEVKEIASFYTPTPGGLGPIDVTYLFHNLIKAAESSK